MPMIPWGTEELSIENEWRRWHSLSTLTRSGPGSSAPIWKQQQGLGNRMNKGEQEVSKKLTNILMPPKERHGASHRITQTLPGGTDQSAPTYADGKQVTRTTTPRGSNPASQNFKMPDYNPPAGWGSDPTRNRGPEVPYQNRRYRTS